MNAERPVIRFQVCSALSRPTVKASLPLGCTDTQFIPDLQQNSDLDKSTN